MSSTNKNALEWGIPPLPDFLDRKKWSAEMHGRVYEARKKLALEQQAELDAIQKRAWEAKEAKKVKDVKDAERALERKAQTEKREAKRTMRNATLAFIRRALDRGEVTANGLRQNAAEHMKDLVPWALRTMLKKGEIKKVSRQTYRRAK